MVIKEQIQNSFLSLPHLLMLSAFTTVLLLAACGKSEKKSKDLPNNPDEKNEDSVDSDDPEDRKEAEDKPKNSSVTPVLLFLGGYTSCPQNSDSEEDPRSMDLKSMFDAAKAGLTNIDDVNESAYLISCYGLDPESISYVLSSAPDKVHFKKVANMEADFATLVKRLVNPVIFITGHSYGAYTALKLVSGSAKETKITGLVTIDAISKVGCTPANALPAVLGIGPAPKQCLEAPTDISSAEQKVILSKSATWLNYYQTDSPILHSGEFRSAQNFKMHYESMGLQPHMDVLFDSDVEESVINLIVTKTKAAADKVVKKN